MPNIVLKNRDGVPVEHPTDRVRLMMSDGNHQEFVNAASFPDPVTTVVELDFSKSNTMEITPVSGELFAKVTIEKPANLLEENVRDGITVAGIKGKFDNGVKDIASESEMNALLTAANVGRVYRYVGEDSETYISGDLYAVEESS